MIIGMKSACKLVGISVIALCAVLVCTLFFNFYLDVRSIEDGITSEISMLYYTAQLSTARVVCLVSGGCLLLTSVVMLFFYIKHYIDTHRRELGILKALGRSSFGIAKSFWVFGSSALIGTAAGFSGAFLLMPRFYALQNKEGLLPEIAMRFHPSVPLFFVALPTVCFSALSIFYARHKLKTPVLLLLRGLPETPGTPPRRTRGKEDGLSFIAGLRRTTLRAKKTLAFFVVFAAFCFSAMMQMSFSMKDLSSEMMGAMILAIGLVLAFTTLFLSITAVTDGNTRTIAVMKAFGYSQRECRRAILDGYRPLACIGFAAGTGYQYALLRIMVDIVFKDVDGVPAYEFDLPAMLVSLAVFAAAYEALMYAYSERIKRISLKQIMLE